MRAPPNPSNEGHSGLKGIPSKDKDNVVGCKYIVYFICGFWPTIFGTSWILLDLLLRSQVLIQCMLYLPGAKTTTTIGRNYVCTRYSHGEMRWRGKELCPTATGYPWRTSTTCALREHLPPSPEGVPGDRRGPNVSKEYVRSNTRAYDPSRLGHHPHREGGCCGLWRMCGWAFILRAISLEVVWMYSVYSVYLGLVLVNYIPGCMYVDSCILISISSLPINLKVVSISICEHRTANSYRRVLR